MERGAQASPGLDPGAGVQPVIPNDPASIFGHQHKGDTKGNQSQAVDEMLARISRLSAADKRAFMKAIRQQERKDDIAWLHKVWGKVTLKDSEITRLVEEVRTEMHAARSPKTRR